jgi:hypothetical protein
METLTTVVSRISMKVASITDSVTTHGFTSRPALRAGAAARGSIVTCSTAWSPGGKLPLQGCGGGDENHRRGCPPRMALS